MPVLNFKGKSSVYSYHLGVPFCSLQVDKQKSLFPRSKNGSVKNPSLDDNLIVHGDNLYALKALLPKYAGKIKCIYIDPPYNTGNETWVFNDNVNNPMMQEWLKKTVDRDDLERHDKWLCMMWPRLQLLKELLSEDGVIFISIDDNEQYRLMAIMEEIFGEEQFIAQCIWETKKGAQGMATKNLIVSNHEYILIYSKNNPVKLRGLNRRQVGFSNPDNDPRGLWKRQYLQRKGQGLTIRQVKNPKTGHIYQIETPYTQSKINQWIKEERIIFDKKDRYYPARKEFLNEYKNPQQIITSLGLYSTKATTEYLHKIFNNKKIFPNPKPPTLLKDLLKMSTANNDIILDSFAGSGTTAHAVLDLNKEDGGNRKFILVECENYADKITAERVRRVIKGVPKARQEPLKKGLGSSFTYCTLGKAMSEENLLKGKSLPSYKVLANYVYYIATGETLSKTEEDPDFYVGKTDKNTAFFVIYKPDIQFLRSKKSALHLERKKQIQYIMKQQNCKKALVFASAHYFDSTAELAKDGIIFCQLPFSIYKVAGV